jgi:hypothetical protein
MTQLSNSSKESRAARPGDAVVSRYLFAVLGAGIFSGLAAAIMLSLLGPTAGPQRAASIPKAEQVASLALEVPAGADPGEVRVTLLQSGRPVQANGGATMRELDPSTLLAATFKPGLYVARVTYRGKPADDLTLRAAPGEPNVLPLAGPKLAAIEYAAGEAADRLHEGDGIPYFRRAVQLDRRHVPAHLQLAAFELVHGSPDAVKAQLTTVRQLDPGNKDAAAVEKLLQARLSHRR